MSVIKITEAFNQLKKTPIGNSKYFTWHEALWLPQMNAYAMPTVEQMVNILKQCEHMDRVREFFNTPVIVTSWLRPDFYNKAIGGATFSHHKTGSATDFKVMGLDSDYVREVLRKHPEVTGGCSFETGITWVHMQNDGRGLWFPPPPKSKGT